MYKKTQRKSIVPQNKTMKLKSITRTGFSKNIRKSKHNIKATTAIHANGKEHPRHPHKRMD
jgi:hypothetical protein